MKHPNLIDIDPLPAPETRGAILAARAAANDPLAIDVDNFAGGGGASTGVERAIGKAIDVAINHDAEAVAMHLANHPLTRHICQSIYAVDPVEAVTIDGAPRPVRIAWFSPDCKHFSKAKGGKPVEKNIRDLAWIVVHWAERLGPRLQPLVILLENVEEFRTWGPLTADNRPCPERKGETFDAWVKRLRAAGYKVEWRELRACDYGAPTSRKRLYLVARCDGAPIRWPAPTHGKPGSPAVLAGKLKPWRTAAEIIDWSIPCPSIFERARPLKEATCRRIAHGIMRFVVDNPTPFIVPLCHTQGGNAAHPGDEPLRTVTTAKGGEFAVCNPFLTPVTHHGPDGRNYDPTDPVPTVTSAHRGEIALVAPHVTKFRGGAVGHDARDPLHTVTANSFIKRPGGATPLGLVTASLVSPLFARTAHGERDASGKKRGKGDHGPEESFPTILASRDSALIAVTLDRQFGRSRGAEAGLPMPAITAGGSGKTALIAATLVKNNFGSNPAQHVTVPLHAITTQANKFGVLAVYLAQHNGGKIGRAADDPLSTVTTTGRHQQAVAATLIQTSYGERGAKYRCLECGEGPFTDPYASSIAGLAPAECPRCGEEEHIELVTPAQAPRSLDIGLPLGTVVGGGGKHGLVAAFLEKYAQNSRGRPADAPLDTAMAGAPRHAIVCAHVEQANSGPRNANLAGRAATDPVSTITATGSQQRIAATTLMKLRGTSRDGQAIDEPLHTVSAGGTHFAEVAAFLVKYYGAAEHGQRADRPLDTVTSLARFGLVTVTIDGEEYVIADIGMRMLTPRELARAQGFPDSYDLTPEVNGRPLTKTAQIRMIGNSVSPNVAEAIAGSNVPGIPADEDVAEAA